MATTIDTILLSVGLDIKDLEKTRKEAERGVKEAREGSERHAKALESVFRDLNTVVTSLSGAFKLFLGGISVEKLVNATFEITKANQSLLKLHELLNMPVEQISRWQGLVKLHGGSVESANTMLINVFDKLNKINKLGESSTGAGLVFSTEGGLGLDKTLYQTQDVNKFLFALADAYSKLPIKERASWRTLINQEWGIPEENILLFTKQSKELKDEMAGIPAITEEEAVAGDKLQQSFAKLGIEIGKLKSEITLHLYQPLKDFFTWLEGILKQSREQGGIEAEDKVRGGKPAPGSTMESVSKSINKGLEAVGQSGNMTAAQSMWQYLFGNRDKEGLTKEEPPTTATKPKEPPKETTPTTSDEGSIKPSSHVSGMVDVTTKGGHKMTLDPEYAEKFKGFVETLEEAGAPIKSLGSYRTDSVTPGSEHPRGRAIDIDQIDRNLAPLLKKWVEENPDVWANALKKYGLHSGEFFRGGGPDFGHIGTVEGANEPGAKEAWPRTLDSSGKVVTKQGNMSDDLLEFYNSIGPGAGDGHDGHESRPPHFRTGTIRTQPSLNSQFLNLPVMATLATAPGPVTNNSSSSTTTIQALNISTRSQSDEMNIGRIPNDFSGSLIPQQYAYNADTSLE